MQYVSGPIGRAHQFSESDIRAIADAIGMTIDADETTESIARRINQRCSHGMNNYLNNLRTLRRVSGYADAVSIHPTRRYIIGKTSKHAESGNYAS